MKLYIDSIAFNTEDMTDSDKDRAKLAREGFVANYGEALKPYSLRFNKDGVPTIEVNSAKDILDISKIAVMGVLINENTITLHDEVMF